MNPRENEKLGNKYIDSIDIPSSKFSFGVSAASYTSLALAAVMSFNQPVTALETPSPAAIEYMKIGSADPILANSNSSVDGLKMGGISEIPTLVKDNNMAQKRA